MANIAAQAASQGLTGSQVVQQSMFGGTGMLGQMGPSNNLMAQMQAQQAQNSAAQQAQSIAQQQLASQGITPMGAGAAEQAALEAGGNPYADSQANIMTAGMAVGDAPVATAGNFSPQTQFAAARIFGPQKFKRKPLITF